MKLKRILAWTIDWILSVIPAIIYSIIVSSYAFAQQEMNAVITVAIALLPFFVLSSLIFFICRDVIFKGQSIAKLIFKLAIIDIETNELPSKSKLIKRNLFFFIYPIEALLLLITNQTIGDMITKTTIINQPKTE